MEFVSFFFFRILLNSQASLHLFCRCIAFEFNLYRKMHSFVTLYAHMSASNTCFIWLKWCYYFCFCCCYCHWWWWWWCLQHHKHMRSFSEFNSISRLLSRFFFAVRWPMNCGMRLHFFLTLHLKFCFVLYYAKFAFNLILCNKLQIFIFSIKCKHKKWPYRPGVIRSAFVNIQCHAEFLTFFLPPTVAVCLFAPRHINKLSTIILFACACN